MAVFVLDKRKKPLMPCCEKRACLLLTRGRAVVYRRQPFTIRSKDRVEVAEITANGRGDYCRVKITAHGFPRGCTKSFKTGDMVRAEVPTVKKAAIHVGGVAVRASGSFRVGNADGINAAYCKLRHRADRYGHPSRSALPPSAEAGGLQRGRPG